MIVTEEEAKTKRCQETYSYGLVTTSPLGFCIGSACMAWRWVVARGDTYGRDDADKGYCGKAGRP